jgi:hypothetical protein
MMLNASCFVPCKKMISSSQEASKSTPYLASKYPTMHTNAHKMVNSMAPKSDSKWCETNPIQPITTSGLSLHPLWANTFTINHYGYTQNLFYS